MCRFPSGSFPLTCCRWAVAKSNFPVSNSVAVFGVKTCQSNPPDVLCCKYKVFKAFDGEAEETQQFQLRKEWRFFSRLCPSHSCCRGVKSISEGLIWGWLLEKHFSGSLSLLKRNEGSLEVFFQRYCCSPGPWLKKEHKSPVLLLRLQVIVPGHNVPSLLWRWHFREAGAKQ